MWSLTYTAKLQQKKNGCDINHSNIHNVCLFYIIILNDFKVI